jgi:antibiotic biosynthesis monooxygenase (ABM) superfamily enzyme
MATVLLEVRATIAKEREAEFNRWYNEEHCAKVVRYSGALSARRFRTIMGDTYQYLTVYEFPDEDVFDRFERSPGIKELFADYDAAFGDVSVRVRAAYAQVWPLAAVR